ncbi:MAG: SUMF1/EgtB/PvdO family nonheme iron enzyme, partial [Verrucomicrobiae bacterium]|nr:SUMF1/EgtB/PvdO family nonheme iron enzyme [Verrucomicrobiae bacterium]
WEYACRAGTDTPFYCPEEKLAEHEVFDPDQTRTQYEKVASLKPNPWGLHDMLGNVMEWCLDQYDPAAYASGKPIVPATKLYPRVARGGSWYDPPENCRCAARTGSSPEWEMQDPGLPKSAWWLTDASWLGFRIVRPLKIPEAGEMFDLWNSGDIPANPTHPDFQ